MPGGAGFLPSTVVSAPYKWSYVFFLLGTGKVEAHFVGGFRLGFPSEIGDVVGDEKGCELN